jgi:uncharacterized protein (TIGR03435 family)
MRIAALGWPVFMLAGCALATAQSADSPQQRAQLVTAVANVAEASPASEGPQFEVATIKPSDPDKCCGRTYRRDGKQFTTHNTYLRWLIQWAYGVQANQIVGGPGWMDMDRYDVVGEIKGTGAPTDREWRVAVQNLLADRFQLKFHHEIKEMPAYALTIARGGAKLTKSDPQKNPVPRIMFGGAGGHTMNGTGRDVTLKDFMGEVQRLALDRPVVDRTGITGTYDIELAFTREDSNSLGMRQLPDSAAPNLFTALEQQLGLKLEGVKAPVDVLVIDRAEPPSEN